MFEEMPELKDIQAGDLVEVDLHITQDIEEKLKSISGALFPNESARKKITMMLHYINQWFVDLSDRDKPQIHPKRITCDVVGQDIYDIRSELNIKFFKGRNYHVFTDIINLFINNEYDRVQTLIKRQPLSDKLEEAKRMVEQAELQFKEASAALGAFDTNAASASGELQVAPITSIHTIDDPFKVARAVKKPGRKKPRKFTPRKPSKKLVIQYPDGSIEHVLGITKFCADHGFTRPTVKKYLNSGKAFKEHKFWTPDKYKENKNEQRTD